MSGQGPRYFGVLTAAAVSAAAVIALASFSGRTWAGVSMASGFEPTGVLTPPPSPPLRIASATFSADEILLTLVPPERIAAVTTVAGIPGVSNVAERAAEVKGRIRRSVDAESMLALSPDLLIMDDFNSPATQVLALDLGLPVYSFRQPVTATEIEALIIDLGLLTGTSEAAIREAGLMRARIEAVQRASRDQRTPTVLYLFSPSFAAGARTLADDAIRIAGGINLAAEQGMTGSCELSVEQFLLLDPDLILYASWDPESKGPVRGTPAGFLVHPALSRLAAVKADRVYGIPARTIQSISPWFAEGVEQLAEVLH